MTDISKEGLDLAVLKSTWQDHKTTDSMDWTVMARKARWTGRRIRAVFFLELFACLVGSCFYGWFFFVVGTLAEQVFAAMLIVWLLGYAFLSVRLHRPVWGHKGANSGLGLIDLQIAQSQQTLNYISLNLKGSILCLLILVPMLGWVLWGNRQDGGAGLGFDGSIALLFAVSFGLVAFYLLLRRWQRSVREKLKSLNQAHLDLTDEP